MTRTELITALDVFRVLETGDPALAAAVAAPDFTNHESAVAPAACSIPGPRGLLASSAWMRSAFDDLRFPILQAGFDEGTAWVRLRMQGAQNRPFVQYHEGRPARVLPATGRMIDFEQIHLLRVGENGVERHEAIRDDLTMLEQLGAFPPSPWMALAVMRSKLSGSGRRAAASATAAAAEAAREH
jgi:hypothetical protein